MSKDIRCGLIARADKTGLGVKTWEFYNHIKPLKTLLVDISSLNGRPINEKWYQYATVSDGFPSDELIDSFLHGISVVYTAETPYNYKLFSIAKERGIKTILHANYEFLDYCADISLPAPDIIACPTYWHYKDIQAIGKHIGSKVIYLPVPVATEHFKYKKRNKIKKILHIAGNKTIYDRNGTGELIEAMRYVKSDVKLVIRSQHTLQKMIKDDRIEIDETNKVNYWDNYEDEDMFVLPRKFGGLCLPLNESLACGMIPLMLGIEHIKDLLPIECQIPTEAYKEFVVRPTIRCYDTDPFVIAKNIERLVNSDLTKINKWVNKWRKENSWKALKPLYLKILRGEL